MDQQQCPICGHPGCTGRHASSLMTAGGAPRSGASLRGALGFWSLLLGSAILIAVYCLGSSAWARAQPGYAEREATRLAADRDRRAAEQEVCKAAINAVQQYRAPGQYLPVKATIQATALLGARPMQLGTWTMRVSTANRCIVSLDAMVSNEYQRYSWTYLPQSGAVTGDNDATKRLSGW